MESMDTAALGALALALLVLLEPKGAGALNNSLLEEKEEEEPGGEDCAGGWNEGSGRL